MPRKDTSNRNSSRNSNKNDFGVQFLNFRLDTDTQKLAEQFYAKEFTSIGFALTQLANDGYKVSISYDTIAKCFQCSVTGGEKSLNPGICMTTRAVSMDTLLAYVVYKVYEYFTDGIWDTELESSYYG